MKKKPSRKLSSIQCHHFAFITSLVILPGKAHSLAVKGLNPRIADRNSVSITTQILHNMSWRLKGFFTENNPLFAVQAINKGKEVSVNCKFNGLIKEGHFPHLVGLSNEVKKLTPRLSRNDLNRNEELLTGTDKTKTIVRKTPSRNDAMNMNKCERRCLSG